jgi:hypothetical protein
MNAAYYNGEPGSRLIDEMFLECADMRSEDYYLLEKAAEEWEDLRDALKGDLVEGTEAECADDIDDAYDLEKEQEYEEDFD